MCVYVCICMLACVLVVCLLQPLLYLHLLLVEADDGKTFAHSPPAVLIVNGAHPWTVALMDKGE